MTFSEWISEYRRLRGNDINPATIGQREPVRAFNQADIESAQTGEVLQATGDGTMEMADAGLSAGFKHSGVSGWAEFGLIDENGNDVNESIGRVEHGRTSGEIEGMTMVCTDRGDGTSFSDVELRAEQDDGTVLHTLFSQDTADAGEPLFTSTEPVRVVLDTTASAVDTSSTSIVAYLGYNVREQ